MDGSTAVCLNKDASLEGYDITSTVKKKLVHDVISWPKVNNPSFRNKAELSLSCSLLYGAGAV